MADEMCLFKLATREKANLYEISIIIGDGDYTRDSSCLVAGSGNYEAICFKLFILEAAQWE